MSKEFDDLFKTTKFEKYFWLPLHWYFLNYILFNPINWIKRIKFRIKHKCPYKDTWSLDYTFYAWVYPRLKRVINSKLKYHVLEKKREKDYKRMLKLSEELKDADLTFPSESAKKSEEFLELWKKYLHSLWW